MVCTHYPIAVIDAFKESIKKIFTHKIFCQAFLEMQLHTELGATTN